MSLFVSDNMSIYLNRLIFKYVLYTKGRTINDLGGCLGKNGEKNSTATRPEKKTQLNNPEEKKTQLNKPEEEKKVQRLVAEEKKSSTASCRGKKNSTRILCPRPPQIINGPSLRLEKWHTFLLMLYMCNKKSDCHYTM